MRIAASLALVISIVFFSTLVHGENGPAPLAVELRLLRDCGSEGAERALTILALELDDRAEAVFSSVLENGASPELIEQARVGAVADWKERQAWAERNAGSPLLRRLSERWRNQAIDGYVAARLDRLNLLLRENAMLGLALIGSQKAGDEFARAVDRDARLASMAGYAAGKMSEP